MRIYIDRLKDGKKELLKEIVDASQIVEQELVPLFAQPITVEGEAYLAGANLVLCLSLQTSCILPCRICNQGVAKNLLIERAYQLVELKSIKAAVFDMHELVRGLVLLEVPSFVECPGRCPEREEIAKYAKKAYHPFAELEKIKIGISNGSTT